MAAFSTETLNTIKDRIRVSDIASRYAKIEHRGGQLWCCCPLHGEKTASMILHDDTGIFHCFGCGRTGNIFDLVMEMEKVPFGEAVRSLAREAGVELKEQSPEEIAAEKEKEALYGLYDRAANFFHQLLLQSRSSGAVEARAYLEKRHVSKQMWETFLIGWCPDPGYGKDGSWSLYKVLTDAKYSPDIIKKSGLFSQNHEDWCLFSGRIVFPVRSWKGQVVAFSGRDLSGRSKAKYINSYESPIFSKRDTLLGLYESLPALKAKDSAKTVIICEGNFDVVALHQAGLPYAMASLGTAFTGDHVKLLKRYADKLVLLFDSDEAGSKATEKGLLTAQEGDMNAVVARLTLGKDSSEVLEKCGPDALKRELSRTQEGFDWLADKALADYNIQNAEGKVGVLARLAPFLRATRSHVLYDDLTGKLAKILGVSQEAVVKDLAGRGGTRKPDDDGWRSIDQERPSAESAGGRGAQPGPAARSVEIRPLRPDRMDVELRLMLLVVRNRAAFTRVRSELGIDDMRNDEAKSLYIILEDAKREGTDEVTDEYILKMIDDPQLKSDVLQAFRMKEFAGDPDDNISEALGRIRIRNLQAAQESLMEQMSLGGSDMNDIVRRFQDVTEQITREKKAQAALRKKRADALLGGSTEN